MNFSFNLRIFLLPRSETSQSLKMFEMPISLEIMRFKKYLLADGCRLYELNVFDYPICTNFDFDLTIPLKSVIFECLEEDIERKKSGYVFENCCLYVATKYNFVYTLIMLIYSKQFFFELSFLSYEHITEIVQSIYSERSSWIESIPTSIFKESLLLICEIKRHETSEYYRFSKDKLFEFLKEKNEKMSLYISSKNNAIYQKIENELIEMTDPTETVPPEVYAASIQKYSINFIFNSYFNNDLKERFVEHLNYDFSELERFVESAMKKKQQIISAESVTNTILFKNKKKIEKSKKIKLNTHSVTVKKGSIDSFFKPEKPQTT